MVTPEPNPRTEEERSASTQQLLRDYGFESGEPVHEYYECFSLEEAKASLFDSTYSKIVTVTLKGDKDDPTIPIVLTRAEPRFTPYRVFRDATPAGCNELPDWYFEGWVPRTGYDAVEEVTRVRIFVNSGFDDIFLWQVIPKLPNHDEIKLTTD